MGAMNINPHKNLNQNPLMGATNLNPVKNLNPHKNLNPNPPTVMVAVNQKN